MIRIDAHRTLAAEHNAGGWTTSCPGNTYLRWLDDVRAIARAAERTHQQEEDESMAQIFRIGVGDSLAWSPHTFVSNGYSARHVTDSDAMEELQDKGIWPTEETRISWNALKQLFDNPSDLPKLGFD